MKKLLSYLLAVVILCALFSSAHSLAEGSTASIPLNYIPKYITETYSDSPNIESSIRIEYPRFQYSDEGVYDDAHTIDDNQVRGINTLITEHVMNTIMPFWFYNGFDSIINVNYQYAVTLNNDRMISIVFWGEFVQLNERTDLVVSTLNIDLATMRNVQLTDMLIVDVGLRALLKSYAHYPTHPETTIRTDILGFADQIDNISPFLFGDESDQPIHCYLKPDGLVLVIPTTHVGGDYFEAQIEYEHVAPLWKLDNTYWN